MPTLPPMFDDEEASAPPAPLNLEAEARQPMPVAAPVAVVEVDLPTQEEATETADAWASLPTFIADAPGFAEPVAVSVEEAAEWTTAILEQAEEDGFEAGGEGNEPSAWVAAVAAPEIAAAPVFLAPLPTIAVAETASSEGWSGYLEELDGESAVEPLLRRQAALVAMRWMGDADGALRRLAGVDGEARWERAAAAVAVGKWSEAHEDLVACASALSGVAAAEVWRECAALAAETGQVDAAEAALRAAVAADPADYAAWLQLRDRAVARGAIDDAVVALEALASQSGRDGLAVEHAFELGVRLQQRGSVDEARTAYARALEIDPLHMRSFLALDAITVDPSISAKQWEAVAAATASRADRAWSWLMAAQAHARVGASARARASFEAAMAAGSSLAHRSLDAWLAREGTPEEQIDFLRSASHESSGAEQALLAYRLGRRAEAAGNHELARQSYAQVLAADPEAAAATWRLEWLDETAGGSAHRAAVQGRAEREAGEARVAAFTLWGRLAERDGTLTEARTAYERALAEDAAYAPALEGVERVLRQTGAWEDLASWFAQRAESASDAAETERRLVQAANAGLPAASAEMRRDWLLRALERNPDAHLLLTGALAVLEDLGDWVSARAILERAAETTFNPVARAEWLERAARIALDRLGDVAGASTLLATARAAEPTSGAVRMLLAELSGAEERLRVVREAAARASGPTQAWLEILCAELAEEAASDPVGLLAQAAERQPHDAALLAFYEFTALRRGSPGEVRRALVASAAGHTGAERAERMAWAAAMAASEGDTATSVTEMFDALEQNPADFPYRGLSVVAERQGAWLAVSELLGRSPFLGDHLHRARILLERLHDDVGAAQAFRELLDPARAEVGPRTARVALGALHAGRRSGDLDLTVAGATMLAELADSTPARRAYAATAAALLDRAGDGDSAPYWEMVLENYPASRRAFEQAVRAQTLRGDAGAVQGLFARLKPADRIGLGDALEACGDRGRALAVWRDATAGDNAAEVFGAWLRIERFSAVAEDWSSAYAAIGARRAIAREESTREALDARRRWILLEKLSETDEAWGMFQELHAQRPGDREVTEALARIAGARGETALSVQYLKTLAEGSADSEQSARYQRRIAEAYERAGDVASARQALLDALDHIPNDRESLAALQRLAAQSGDWSGVVAVLQRQIGLTSGEERRALRRELATVTEQRLGDPRVAMEAWRSVLDENSDDEQALERSAELSASVGDWAAFVDVGARLAERRSGAERTALWRRVGLACQAALNPADALRFFERAIGEEPPDAEAARALAALHAQRGDWSGHVRAIRAEASVSVDRRARAALLARAAKTELDMRQDASAAARLYAEVLEYDPEHEAAVRFQVERLTSREGGEAAIPVFERLEPYVLRDLDLDDFDARLEASIFFFRFAEALGGAGRRGEALTRYERALELNPTHLPSLEAAGPLYVEAKQWEVAHRVYRQILQLTGGHGEGARVAQLYTQLGVVERALGSDDKAQKRFAKALEVHPNHAPALRGLADLAEARRDWSGCLNHYNTMIMQAASPDDILAGYIGKGRILDEHLERIDKAEAHYQGCFEIEPEYPSALLRLSELALRQGAWSEASTYAARGLGHAEVNGTLRASFALARAAAASGQGSRSDVALALETARPADPTLMVRGDETAEALRLVLRGRLPTA
jgi:tetratricopeptide (TPR) repeat protein